MSHIKITQQLEWCTLLPSIDHSQESPVFVLNGNEWFFRFFLQKYSNSWYYEVYLDLKNKYKEIKPCSVSFQLGFKNEQTLSLETGTFTTSEHFEVWSNGVNTLNSKLPKDYLDGNWIKFVFCFHDNIELLSKDKKEKGDKSIQTLSYVDTRFVLESVTNDFSKLFEEGTNYDVEFICGDQTIKAHKIILSCRSDVIASMLQSDMKEGQTGRVNIHDIDVNIFKLLLKFLYTGMLPELSFETASHLYEASDKYNVSSLKKFCSDYLVDNLSLENICDILVLADRHNDSNLKKVVLQNIVLKEHKTE